MTTAEEKYKDIINKRWDDNPNFFIRHPRMPLEERAKIFAPFAALRGHGERLSQETDAMLRSERMELSEEETANLSDRLRQLEKGMEVTIVYFAPDSEDGSMGYYVSISGTVVNVDSVYQVIKINTEQSNEKGAITQVIHFRDLLNIQIYTNNETTDQ